MAVAAERGERLSARGSQWVDESRQMVTAVIVLTPESVAFGRRVRGPLRGGNDRGFFR